MKAFLSLFLALALVGPALGQTPPNPPPLGPVVILPDVPTPTPPPVPPGTPTTLTPNMLYVINASAPVMVLASPDGIVKVTSDSGPLKIRGVFVDGNGKIETRIFKGPNVYTLEPVANGTCELIVVPSPDASSVLRRTLTVQTAPPVPPPNPPPPGPPDSLVQSLSDALKTDAQPVAVAQNLAKVYRAVALSTVNNTAVATYTDLFTQVKILQDAAVDSTKIPNLRAVIGKQFTAAFPSATAPIDRALAAKTFNAVASALEGVK